MSRTSEGERGYGQEDDQLSDHLSGKWVVIAYNPIAGRRPTRQLAEKLANFLQQEGLKVSVFDNVWQASEIAASIFHSGQLRAFVGVGGDGTIATQVNHTPPGLPLALLPAGTGNVFAKSVGLPTRPESIARALISGKKLTLDAGRANGALFLNMVSCGFDAAVASAVHEIRLANRRGGHIGYRSYIGPILGTLRSYCFPPLEVTVIEPANRTAPAGSPSDPLTFRVRWVFVCNLPRYGWGIRIAPGASAQDGVLDCWMFDRGGFWRGLWYALWVQLGGRHRRLRDCRHVKGRRFLIRSDAPVPCQRDGDPAGHLPVEIEVLPRRATIIVP
ncbi:MAG: hypothetical protein NZ899_08620 [Thermoguttaceae bacterium]|nr:hypothetical protein [Thermoguttaceae bacterium]MDW8077992.1 diacylglycerol kinase family protein [Thermoguttaceae bacterium]